LQGALEIIRFALDTLQPQSGVRPTTLASRDLPQEMLVDRPATPVPASEPASSIWQEEAVHALNAPTRSRADSANATATRWTSAASTSSTLVYRPKESQPAAGLGFETDLSSEDEGFAIVHRPKPAATLTPEDPMSSPEPIPAQPIDVLALTGSAYPDDDEWTLL
jgi:hypothetical protein